MKESGLKLNGAELMFYDMSNYDYDRLFYERAVWRLRFALLPHRCDKSGKRIWFEFAFRGKAMYGPIEHPTTVETRWLTPSQFLMKQLSRKDYQ